MTVQPPFWFRTVSRFLPKADRSEMRADFLEWYDDKRRRQPRWRADGWLFVHTMRAAVRLRADRGLLTGLGDDLRTPLRQLRRSPGVSLAVIVVLSLGIGATTSVFSLINAAFIAPMSVADPDRLVVLGERFGTRTVSVSYPNFLDWQTRVTSTVSMAAYQSDTATLRHGSSAARLRSVRVSRDWMQTLGVAPVIGRAFSTADHVAGAPLTVLLSHSTWTTYFGADRSVIGRSVLIDDLPHTIVGVMAPGFDFYRDADAWIPLEPFAADLMDRRTRAGTAVIARIRPDVTEESLRGDLEVVAAQLARDHPDANTNVTATVIGLREALVGPGGSSLWLLFAAVIGLLAVGCLNAANLLSARVASRRHEFSLRSALGASSARVARQVLIEGLVLAVAAGVVGALVSWGMVTMAVRLGPPGIPGLATAGVDARVLLFGAGLSVCVGVIFGLVPLVQARTLCLQSSLADSGRSMTGSRKWRRVRSAIVVGQVALSLTLLSGSTLMARTLLRLVNTDVGFDTTPVLAASIQLNTPGTPEEGRERVRRFYAELVSRLEQRPGVAAVAVANPVPLFGGGRQNTYWIEGQPYTGPSDLIRGIDTASVTGRYFETLGITLIKGRTFDSTDTGASPPVVVVDEMFAQRYWPGEEALGKRIGGPPGGTAPQATVIGVVTPVRQADVAEAPRPQVYRHQSQWPLGGTLLVRASGDPLELAETVRAEVAALDPAAPVWSIRRLDDIVSSSLALSRFSTAVLSAFALVGLALAGLGIYGLVAYDVAQRTREIGVYLALGATASVVRLTILRRALSLVVLGAALGLAGSVGLAQALHATFANLTTNDPLAYVASTAVILLAGVAGSFAPSVRAGRVDPITAMR